MRMKHKLQSEGLDFDYHCLHLRPVSLPRLSLLTFLESSFPGNSLWIDDSTP